MVDNFIEHTPIDLARIETIPRVYTRAVNLAGDRRSDISGPWVYRPYLYWLHVKLSISPVMTQGMLEYQFGQIHRHDQLYEQFYPELDISGHQALLTILHPDGQEEFITAGFVLGADLQYFENTANNGIQRLRFYGFEYLFQKYDIYDTLARCTSDETSVYPVRRAYSFNLPIEATVVNQKVNQERSVQIRGNMVEISGNEEEGLEPFKTFAHVKIKQNGDEEPADLWSAWDVLQYWINSPMAMANKTPKLPMQGASDSDSIQYELDVPEAIQDVLKRIWSVWPQEDKNLYQFFCDLLPRELGLFWYLKYEADFSGNTADRVKFVVDSLTSTTVNFGDFSVVPNTNSINFVAVSNPPNSHFVRLPDFTIKDAEGYDQINILGSPVIVMFNLEAFKETDEDEEKLGYQMRNAWGPVAEDAFNDGPEPTANATVNDLVRAADYYKSVYREFELSNLWEWTNDTGDYLDIRDTDNTRRLDDLSPTFTNPFPEVKLGKEAHSSLIGKEFLRELPILTGINYSVSPIEDNNFSPANITQIPMGVLALDNNTGSPLEGKWVWLDKLSEIPYFSNKGLSGAHVTPLQGRPAVAIESENPILLAKTHFPFTLTEMQPGQAYFQWDNDLIFVVAMEVDCRLERKVSGGGKMPDTRKIIYVPDCHLWYAMPGTAYDIDPATGGLLAIHPDNRMIRNDAWKIDLVAGLANHWLNTQRNIVTIEMEGTSATPPIAAPLGYLITEVTYQPGPGQPPATVPIGSTITSITINMEAQTTQIETDYPSLDGSLRALYGLM